MIFRVFGINRLPVRRRAHIGRINEVVGHRNLIAHGTETANDIGRRYTRADISHITAQMRSVCLLLIQVLNVIAQMVRDNLGAALRSSLREQGSAITGGQLHHKVDARSRLLAHIKCVANPQREWWAHRQLLNGAFDRLALK
jgi:hypothetical protein